MVENTERQTAADTARAIADLAGRLNKDEVSFIDVFRACDKQLISVTGEPALTEDPELTLALEQFATAASTAFLRQQRAILDNVMWNIGYRIASGDYGADFFNAIKKKK